MEVLIAVTSHTK